MNFRHILLSILAGALLSAGWYIYPLFTFFGFIPIFIIQKEIAESNLVKKNARLFLFSYMAFLLWNIGVTWWIVNSTWVGATLAFVLNSLFMALVALLARITTQKFKNTFPIFTFPFTFIFYWLAFEYLHLDWDLSWTWLNLGNCFASAHYLVQWYEYTGVSGGTLWILLVNLFAYNILKQINFQIKNLKYTAEVVLPVLLIAMPIVLSLIIYSTYKENGISNEIVVVQPNIDPYNEKFPGNANFIPYEEQLQRLLTLTRDKLSRNTRFVAWPETSLPVGYDEDLISDQAHIRNIKFLLTNHPGITLITGGDTYKIYHSEYDKTSTARYGEGVGWYDYFNTALKIDRGYKVGIYHKSKLVPGVEQMPFPSLLKWVESFAINMGGITGSLGKQKERTVFYNEKKIGVAPVICYESIYGEFVSEFVRNGANYIFIITNDGWWGNTPGHTQHLAYGKLRAIETRRSIARAANTGISGFINQKGDIILQNKYWVQDALRASLLANDRITFYVKNGDMIGSSARYISFLFLFGLIISTAIQFFKRK